MSRSLSSIVVDLLALWLLLLRLLPPLANLSIPPAASLVKNSKFLNTGSLPNPLRNHLNGVLITFQALLKNPGFSSLVAISLPSILSLALSVGVFFSSSFLTLRISSTISANLSILVSVFQLALLYILSALLICVLVPFFLISFNRLTASLLFHSFIYTSRSLFL